MDTHQLLHRHRVNIHQLLHSRHLKKKTYGWDWAEMVKTNSMQCLLDTLCNTQAGREGNQDVQDDKDSIRSAEDAPEPNQEKTRDDLCERFKKRFKTLREGVEKQRDEAIVSLYRNYSEDAVAVQSAECNQSCDAIDQAYKPVTQSMKGPDK